MGILLTSAAASVVFLALLYLWRFLSYVYFEPRRQERVLRRNGFRGNRYKFLHGDLKEMREMTRKAAEKPLNFEDNFEPRVSGFYLKTIKSHGNCCFVWLGPKATILVSDPDLVKDVLSKPDDYGKPIRTNPLQNLFIRGLVAHEGEKWTKHRRIMNPAFHLEKLKLMVPAFALCAKEILKKWGGFMSPEGSAEIDVWPDLQKIASDAISRTAFGKGYEEGRKIFDLLKEQAANVNSTYVSVNIPGTQYLPLRRNRRMKEIERELQSLIRGVIEERIKSMESGKACNEDLLGLMLETNSQEIKQGNKNSGMTLEEIAEECKLFYFGGQETTSILLVWTSILLSRYPEWQEKAREEVLAVYGNKTPHFDGVNQLKVVNMILHEVLRLYPPVPAYGRRAKEDIKMGKYTLPAGSTLQLQILFLHHSAEVWGDDALEFKPERFREGVVKAQKVPGIFFPFGWGPRMCIGQAFTMLEAKIVLAMMLQRFSFQLSSSYVHAPFAVMTIKPQHGAKLLVHKL